MATKSKTAMNGDADSDNIKVAVRVRPFSEREIKRKAELIISMDKKSTAIKNPHNPKEPPKLFTFDHSYWSHNGYTARDNGYHEPKNKKYADQERIFEDLGRSLLENAWLGYNCSIFAYGQTGSGKSYSITGHGANDGLVPRTCCELFNQIQDRKSNEVAFEVTFSMLEIYNEQVRDLLSKERSSRSALQVREHPDKGFYVESLKQVPVGTYEDIDRSISAGNKQRTIAATKMNEISSRAHTIVTINFIQNSKKQKTSTHSVINLVDLAGSERQKQTESTGDRFTEAKNINQSLSTLGNVIHALVENTSKKQGTKVPVMYRNSVLTMLLKNAIGGNSKTIMIAAISPDAENYDQTLSTLKYADRVKQIRTDAKVNKVDTGKLLQGLIAEKETQLRELQKQLTNKQYSEDEISKLKAELDGEIQRYRDQMVDIDKEIERRVQEARKEAARKEREEKEAEERLPHLINLNEDPALTGKLKYFCRNSTNLIGNGKDSGPDITLSGPGIVKEHARIAVSKDKVTLERRLGMVLHNGREMDKPAHLRDGDRIRFGSNNLYIFRLPSGPSGKEHKTVKYLSFEDAQEEIFKHSGLEFMNDKMLQEEVMNLLPMVQGVNAMAEDMNRPVEFSILLVSPEARGLESGRTEVFIKMVDLETSNEYLWDKNKFIVRYGHMQEMYETYESTGRSPRVSKEQDPFWEPASLDVIVGVTSVPLSFLAYMVELNEEPLSIIDYMANHCGYLKVELLPCDSKGKVNDNLSVKDPNDLVEKSVAFKIKVCQATNLPSRFTKTWCRYKFYDNSSFTSTEVRDGHNPKYNHEHLIKIPKVDYKFLQYLEKSLPIEIWGQQKEGSKQGSQVSLRTIRTKKDDSQLRKIDELEARNKKLEDKLERIKKIVEKLPEGSEKKNLQKLLRS